MIHLPIALIGIAMPVLLASMHISSAIVEAEHPTLIRVALFLQCGAISWFMINLPLFIIRFAGPVHAASLGGLCDFCSQLGSIPYQFLLGHYVIANHDFATFLVLT